MMALETLKNVSGAARIWPDLANAETGRTLELAPGELAQVDVPDGFFDPYLQLVTQSVSAPKPKAAKAPKPAPPAKPAPAESAPEPEPPQDTPVSEDEPIPDESKE